MDPGLILKSTSYGGETDLNVLGRIRDWIVARRDLKPRFLSLWWEINDLVCPSEKKEDLLNVCGLCFFDSVGKCMLPYFVLVFNPFKHGPRNQ